MKQTKIAFMGTSSVGKTTLLDLTRQKFPNAIFVEEAARDFFKNNFVGDRFGVEAQGKIQDLALSREKIAHKSNKPFIFCDRSVLDAVVYTKENGDLFGAENLFQKVKAWIPTYSHFILLDPADIPYESDEIRTESEIKRNKFHEVFLSFFNEKRIPFILLSGSVEVRLLKLERLLKIAN